MRRRRRAAFLAAAAAVSFVLSACDGGDPGPEKEKSTPSADGQLTAPGTQLELGETATVTRTDGTGVLELTVTAIEQGNPADIADIGLDDADQRTPYYVRYELELVSGNGQGLAMQHYLSAWAGDTEASELIVFGPFTPCQEVALPVESEPGDSVTSCRDYLTDKGEPPVDTVRFDNDDNYDLGKDTAIEWR